MGDALSRLWPSQSVNIEQGWLGWLAGTSSRLEKEVVEGRDRNEHRPAVSHERIAASIPFTVLFSRPVPTATRHVSLSTVPRSVLLHNIRIAFASITLPHCTPLSPIVSLTPHNRRRPRMQSPLVIEPHPDRIYYTAAPRRCAVSPIRNTLRKMAHLDSLLPSPSPSPPLQTDPNPRPLVLPIQMFETLAGTRRPLSRVTRQNQLQPTPPTVLNVCSSQAHAHPHRTEECAHDVH